jgi:hypothetical protein
MWPVEGGWHTETSWQLPRSLLLHRKKLTRSRTLFVGVCHWNEWNEGEIGGVSRGGGGRRRRTWRWIRLSTWIGRKM